VAQKHSLLDTIRIFQTDVAAIRGAEEPLQLRLTMHVLVAFVAVCVLALFIGQIDRVVNSVSGKIVATTPPSVYQALDTSIIKSIDVKEGERVAKGQVMATLDPTFTGADVRQLTLQVASLTAQIARASAEKTGKAPVFHPEDDPDLRHYVELQQRLFIERSAQYAAQVTAIDRKIDETGATIQKLLGDQTRLQQREKIAHKVEDMRTVLAQKGAGSLLNELASQDQRLEILRNLESQTNSLAEANQQLAGFRANRDAFIQQWMSDLSKEIVAASNSLDAANAQLQKAQRHQDLIRLVASEESIVLTVAKLSVGSILRESEPFITAASISAPLEAEVHVASKDVGFIRPGDHATIKIDAFDFVEHGQAEGRVKWISEGAFSTNEDTNAAADPYYRARIAIDRMDFVKVPKTFRLIPGMTLQANIHVGRRALGTYLLEGFFKGASGAMREP
jgi:hemolysin D